MNANDDNLYRFDDCQLDLAARELRRDGELVALEPRVFALLAYLIAHRDRAVDKDEIQDAVWSGMVVSETALTRAIMKARRAVGDGADRQGVIRTVHGHGYQFVATLGGLAEPSAELPPARRTLGRWSGAILLLAVAAAVAITVLWPERAPPGEVRLAILPVDDRTADTELGWTRLGLMGFANDLAAQDAELSVLPASDVIRYAEVNGLPGDEQVAATLEEMRDLYGVSHVLASRLEKNANVLRLSYALYRPNGEVERGTMVGAEPTRLMRGMIRSIGDSLGASKRAAEINVVSEDPFINEAYSRGLALSLEGRCGEALRLFEIVRAGTEPVGQADYEWAKCARVLGHWQDAETAFRKILETLPEEPASSLRALAFDGLATVLIRTGRAAAAREVLAAGLREAERAGDFRLQGMLLNNLAIEAKDRREFAEARDLLARAAVAHNRAGGGLLPGRIPAALANIDMAEGKLDEADRHLGQALSAFRATGDRRTEAMMLNNLGYLRRMQGRLAEAEPLHLESLSIRRDIGDRVGQGRILGMLSILYEAEGRYEEARQAADEAFGLASAANDKLFMATALAQRGQAELGLDDLDSSLASFRESRALFEEIGDVSRTAQVDIRLARVELRAGEPDAAGELAAAVLAVSRREALHEPAIEALELQGDLARQRQDGGAAEAAYREMLELADESGFVERKTDVVVKLLDLLLDRRDLAAAEPLAGYLIEQEDTPEGLRARARFAFLAGDAVSAATLLESLRAADDWTPADEQALREYRQAAAMLD